MYCVCIFTLHAAQKQVQSTVFPASDIHKYSKYHTYADACNATHEQIDSADCATHEHPICSNNCVFTFQIAAVYALVINMKGLRNENFYHLIGLDKFGLIS